MTGEVVRPIVPEREPLDARVISRAAEWVARLHGGGSDADVAACARWRQANPDHELAWQRMTGLARDIAARAEPIGAGVASQTLRHAAHQTARRRALHWMLATGGVGLGASAFAVREPMKVWRADLRTLRGERRVAILDDGTRVELNTDSAIDVHMSAERREIVLIAGEIVVTTGRDDARRPFAVRTRNGLVRPIGTRFQVREMPAPEGLVRVAVFDGEVDVVPADATLAPLRVHAGQQTEFSRLRATPAVAALETTLAWGHGMLVADEMPLGEFIAELSRYRTGVLRCDPAVAALPVIGAFPLADTDRVLAMLPQVLPVRIHSVTRYWVTVGSAKL
ncbi:MAG: FecR domain-containing protein [Achromobacter sp.]